MQNSSAKCVTSASGFLWPRPDDDVRANPTATDFSHQLKSVFQTGVCLRARASKCLWPSQNPKEIWISFAESALMWEKVQNQIWVHNAHWKQIHFLPEFFNQLILNRLIYSSAI